MSPFSSRSRVFTVLPEGGAASGARAAGSLGTDDWVQPGGSWTQVYAPDPSWNSGPLAPWDIANEGYFDGVDEMVVPANGVYFVWTESNISQHDEPTSGYVEAVLTKNGTVIGSVAASWIEQASFGYVWMPTIQWVGAALKNDRFKVILYNNSNGEESFGWYQNCICVLRVA